MTYPILAAFITAFSTPPADDTWAPTFHNLDRRSGRAVLSTSFVAVLRVWFLGESTGCSMLRPWHKTGVSLYVPITASGDNFSNLALFAGLSSISWLEGWAGAF